MGSPSTITRIEPRGRGLPTATRGRAAPPRPLAPPPSPSPPRRLVSNFAALSLAELACRGLSLLVTVALTRRLGTVGFGRIEFAFNLILWLVLLVREGFDLIAAREIARHPRLVRPLVRHVLAVRLALGFLLFVGVNLAGRLTLRQADDRALLALSGLMLLTTALGLDFAFRGLERMRLLAVSLLLRTLGYATAALGLVAGPGQILWVPVFLVGGELLGIGLVWAVYVREFGWPRPDWRSRRLLRVTADRAWPVYLMRISQAMLATIDLLVVGLLRPWDEVGRYSAANRLIAVALTLGVIFQQVTFPGLARAWRQGPGLGRRVLGRLVALMLLGYLPVALGVSLLAGPLVGLLFPATFRSASTLLAVGIWKAPLLALAFLDQTTWIGLGRQGRAAIGLAAGTLAGSVLITLSCLRFGPMGATVAMLALALALWVQGRLRIRSVGTPSSWAPAF